jgi:hypothetical protein
MSIQRRLKDERGVAIVIVLLASLAVSAIALGAAMMSTTTQAVNLYSDRLGKLEAAAEGGIERARSAINGDKGLYPESLFVTLEDHAPVTDANGGVIANVRRTTYVGPSGITSGQYGVFGSIVSVAVDDIGNKVIRRGEVFQESFAKFAYFTDSEGGNIWFGGGDQLFGPVHSNDQIKIHNTGVTFHGEVRTAKNVYQYYYGTFKQGYEEFSPVIPMPTTADLDKLRVQAQAGQTDIVGDLNGGLGQATTRIEFIAVDINGDGDVTDDNEGFMRVYRHPDANWVTGDVSQSGSFMQSARNCGDYHDGQFVSAASHPFPAGSGHNALDALTSGSRRCYLGGADSLWGAFQANDAEGGTWLQWPGAVAPQVMAARPADAAYLFPISREFNPSFKGVVHVTGKVVLSGVVRGDITVAATGDIILGDDLIYATDPGAGTCNDIVGLFSGANVVVADNGLNAPNQPASGASFRTYDDTRDEFFHAVVLALSSFTVENYDAGSATAEPCQGTTWGRGCLYLTGGIIQATRGAVGLANGRGHLKRYAYDQCAASNPPPYFPTTGHFAKGRFFEVDPVGFDVSEYYRLLTPRN